MSRKGAIRIGIGGWSYAPWRGTFYPADLAQKDELSHAARRLTAIEINSTYYRSQKPETFAKWREAVPQDFVFAVKAPRYATSRKQLAEAGESVERFLTGGVLELGERLGPILWQLPVTTRFDAEDMTAFLSLLAPTVEGRALRHALEVRHESFRVPEMVELARSRGIGIVWAADSPHPEIPDATGDFAYIRLMGTQEDEPTGYGKAGLDRRAGQLTALAGGKQPPGIRTVAGESERAPVDVFCFVIGGCKVRNPAAAMALIERVR